MVQTEVEFFKTDKSFERTYGWSWFLKLYLELKASPFDANHGWSKTLKPLADHIVEKYKDFLPKLVYPLRIGTHANTAFGLIFPIDYTDRKTSNRKPSSLHISQGVVSQNSRTRN